MLTQLDLDQVRINKRLRRKMIKFFERKRLLPEEEWADKTFKRVEKLCTGKEIISYLCLGMARLVYEEHKSRYILLEILDPDPARANEEFERLQNQLTMFFRKCASDDEDLMSETIDRVTRNLTEGEEVNRDVAGYCFGVAKRVRYEYWRRQKRGEESDVQRLRVPEVWVKQCLRELQPESRWLLRQYHQGEGEELERNRNRLAEQLEISKLKLSKRCSHLKKRYERCVKKISGETTNS